MKFITTVSLVALFDPLIANIYNAYLVFYYEAIKGRSLSERVLRDLYEGGFDNVLVGIAGFAACFIICLLAYAPTLVAKSLITRLLVRL